MMVEEEVVAAVVIAVVVAWEDPGWVRNSVSDSPWAAVESSVAVDTATGVVVVFAPAAAAAAAVDAGTVVAAAAVLAPAAVEVEVPGMTVADAIVEFGLVVVEDQKRRENCMW